MPQHYLATYVNDHLSGAVVALSLLEHLQKRHADTPLGEFLATLQAAITADRQTLELLMERCQIHRSHLRRTSAWFSEWFMEFKLRLDDPQGEELYSLQALEVLSVGIEGKRLLWTLLAATAEQVPELQQLDYQKLIRRAEEQRQWVEAERVKLGIKALVPQR